MGTRQPEPVVKKPTVASVVAAADDMLRERAAECNSREDGRVADSCEEVSLEGVECAPSAGYQDRIKAHLAAELKAGATLYGYREDGSYVARTRHGDRILPDPAKDAPDRSVGFPGRTCQDS